MTAAVLMTTLPGRAAADALARALVAARHAACVQITPVVSTYRWEGAVETAEEQLLLVKTAAPDAAQAAILAAHPYAVPEVIRLDIAGGASAYLAWLAAESAVAPPPGRR